MGVASVATRLRDGRSFRWEYVLGLEAPAVRAVRRISSAVLCVWE
jgi:hypothetical protein